MNKFLEFISYGIITPILYLIYTLIVVLFTFMFLLPFVIGIYFIQEFMNLVFYSGLIYDIFKQSY